MLHCIHIISYHFISFHIISYSLDVFSDCTQCDTSFAVLCCTSSPSSQKTDENNAMHSNAHSNPLASVKLIKCWLWPKSEGIFNMGADFLWVVWSSKQSKCGSKEKPFEMEHVLITNGHLAAHEGISQTKVVFREGKKQKSYSIPRQVSNRANPGKAVRPWILRCLSIRIDFCLYIGKLWNFRCMEMPGATVQRHLFGHLNDNSTLTTDASLAGLREPRKLRELQVCKASKISKACFRTK